MSRPERDADPTRPPSDAAVERLARALDSEVGDLRRSLEDDIAIARVLSAAGERGALRFLLDRRCAQLDEAEERLGRVVADAAVEREAEFVLAATRIPDDGSPPETASWAARVSGLGEVARGVLVGAAAVAAAILVIVRPIPSTTGDMVLGSRSSGDETAPSEHPSRSRWASGPTWGWSPAPVPSRPGTEREDPSGQFHASAQGKSGVGRAPLQSQLLARLADPSIDRGTLLDDATELLSETAAAVQRRTQDEGEGTREDRGTGSGDGEDAGGTEGSSAGGDADPDATEPDAGTPPTESSPDPEGSDPADEEQTSDDPPQGTDGSGSGGNDGGGGGPLTGG